MWKHALENRYIEDPHVFLTELTERQDIIVNMTQMTNDELYDEVTSGLQQLSDALDLGLTGERLIKTGGFAKHGKNQVNAQKRPEVSANLRPSLNYADMEGGM